MNLFKRLLKRNRFPATAPGVKFAFTCGGTDYFQYDDFNNMPALRGLKTMVYFEEMRMKCTLEFLRMHVDAVDNILTQQKINIYEAKKLNDQLGQRLDMAIDTELLYKLASIIFFDKSEDPTDFDFAYNQKKVEHWKEHGGADFFLQQPLQESIPILKSIDSNFQKYSEVVRELNKVHLENLSRHLPESKMKA